MCFIRSWLNQLDHYKYIKRMDVFRSCFNHLDNFECIKRIDVFHTLVLKPTRSL